MCRVSGYSRQAYYERRNYLYRERLEEEVVVSLVREVRKDFPRMGTRKLLVYLEPQFSRMDLSVEAVMRRYVGARGPQGQFCQPYQADLDLRAGRATIIYEQQTAENLGESIFQADPEELSLERS